MFVSAWQHLSPRQVFARRRTELPFPLAAPRLGFHVARYGIYHLTRNLDVRPDQVVLVPAYHSGNETAAIRAAGAGIRYYSIDRNLMPDFDELERLCADGKVAALYVIHFMGWAQPMDRFVGFCAERGIPLVEDCALSMLSEYRGRPLGSFGEYSVFCLYKTLPVPNGGVLVDNVGAGLPEVEMRPIGALTTGARVADTLLRWARVTMPPIGKALTWCKSRVGSLLQNADSGTTAVGDIGFAVGDADLAISGWTTRLLDRFDYADIVRRRRENFAFLEEQLQGHVSLLERKLEEGMCPLFFPILVNDKTRTAGELRARGVHAVEFWNEGTGDPGYSPEGFDDTEYLRRHIVEIPIHQTVSRSQLKRIVLAIKDLDPALRFVAPATPALV